MNQPINNHSQDQEKPQPVRITVKEFKQDGFVVQVQKTMTSRPYYALIIGTENDKTGWLRKGIVPLYFEGTGHIEGPNVEPAVLTILMCDAIDFARQCRQGDENDHIMRMQEREFQDLNRGKPKTNKTGKTERERNKRRKRNDE